MEKVTLILECKYCGEECIRENFQKTPCCFNCDKKNAKITKVEKERLLKRIVRNNPDKSQCPFCKVALKYQEWKDCDSAICRKDNRNIKVLRAMVQV